MARKGSEVRTTRDFYGAPAFYGEGALTTFSSGTARVPVWSLDQSTDETVGANIILTEQLISLVLMRVYWAHASASAFDVVWDLGFAYVGNGETISTGSVSVTDTGGTADTTYVSEWVGQGGSTPFNVGKFMHFRVTRDANNASDTLDAEGYFIGVEIQFTQNVDPLGDIARV